jgi:type VI secretion system secreted protein VgrG
VPTGLPPASLVPAAPAPASSSTTPYDPIIHAADVRAAFGVDGSGLTAAVIDTGVNYRHPALGGGLGDGSKVVAGVDFGENDADPDPGTLQHGTSVAGLIAGADATRPGVAPGASIAALKVFTDDHRGSYRMVINALQWSLDNAETYAIGVVNISISDNQNYATDWFSNDGGVGQTISGLIDQLAAKGVAVVAAAGNSFRGEQGMGFLAILPNTVSVTSTNLADVVPSDAQRLGATVGGPSATDLAAPSVDLDAPQDGDRFVKVTGTSFAAPLVSGSILLLQEIYKKRFGALPAVHDVVGWLKAGATEVSDPVTGLNLSRIDLLKSANLVPFPTPVTPPPPTPPPAPIEPPPIETALTDLYQDGVFVARVPSDSPANPIREGFAAFDLAGTFQTVHSWSASGTGTPAPDPGSATPAASASPSATVSSQPRVSSAALHRTPAAAERIVGGSFDRFRNRLATNARSAFGRLLASMRWVRPSAGPSGR